IVYLEDSLRALAGAASTVPLDGRLAELVSTFVEGLDFVLLTAIEALESGAPETVTLLIGITEDSGDLMERIRQQFLEGEGSVSSSDRAVLLQVTSVFERIVWMTHRLARLLAPPAGGPRVVPSIASQTAVTRDVDCVDA